MDLQNGYKVIYEKTADGKRSFYASKTGLFKDAELITEATIGEYKLIYEKNGMFYGSSTGIPTEDDYCFEEFKTVFEKADTSNTEDPEPENTETTNETDPEDTNEAGSDETGDPENAVDPAEGTEEE